MKFYVDALLLPVSCKMNTSPAKPAKKAKITGFYGYVD